MGSDKSICKDDVEEPILVALGANLPSPIHGPPLATLEAAVGALAAAGLEIRARSGWWESPPVPVSDQPWYVNGVVEIGTRLGPEALLAKLHEIEAAFGRVRGLRNAARVLDLDLLAYGSMLRDGPEPPLLPHPRLAERGFVLRPLAQIRPDWRHPVSGLSVRELIARLPAGQFVRLLPQSAASD
jgi:2-amino-4-hydroxy-6-hydroxymethyldihydropteridine diphosphokinase